MLEMHNFSFSAITHLRVVLALVLNNTGITLCVDSMIAIVSRVFFFYESKFMQKHRKIEKLT